MWASGAASTHVGEYRLTAARHLQAGNCLRGQRRPRRLFGGQTIFHFPQQNVECTQKVSVVMQLAADVTEISGGVGQNQHLFAYPVDVRSGDWVAKADAT